MFIQSFLFIEYKDGIPFLVKRPPLSDDDLLTNMCLIDGVLYEHCPCCGSIVREFHSED